MMILKSEIIGSGEGDCFILSSTAAADFIYETDLSIEAGVAAALIFHATEDAKGFYCANIDTSGFVKLWRPEKVIRIKHTEIKRNTTYHLKVVTMGDNIKVFLDGHIMIDVRDSTYASGYLGFNIFYGTGLFQNAFYTEDAVLVGSEAAPATVNNRIVGIYVSCEDSKRAKAWYTEVLALPSLKMENGIDFMLMNWGEKHKPIDGPAIFSLYATDIHKAYDDLKSRGANLQDDIASYGPSLGFHVKDSEGNTILIING